MNGQVQSNLCNHAIRAHQLCMDLVSAMELINSSYDSDDILHMVVEESCRALGCESAQIAMREGDNWVITSVKNLPDSLIGRSFTDQELPHAALAMTTRKPLAIDDVFHDDRTNPEMMESLGIKSIMVLPLLERNVVTGTMLFGYHSRGVSFVEPELDYAGRMAIGVAIAVRNARLHHDLEESKRLGEALNEIDDVLYSILDYDAIMNKMLQLATDVIGAETAVIFSREGDRWSVRYEYNLPVSLLGQSFTNTEVMHTAVTAKTKRSLVVQDALNSPDIDQKFVEMLGIRSLLDFPLIIKGEVIGDLTFHYHSSAIPFNERQVEFARKLQISISLALENHRLLETFKQSESMLKEAERLGKSGYFKYDVHTRKITWSQGVFHIFGRDPVLGEPTVEEFFALYSLDPGREKMRELMGSEATSEFDAEIKRGDLSYVFHFAIRSVKDEKGDFAAYFGTIQDITERKRDEESLREGEKRFHAIFDLAAVGIAQVNLNGHWMLMNQKLSDILGYSFDELRNMTLQQISHPDDIEPHLAHIRRLLAGEVPSYTMEKRYICKVGSILWVNLNVTLVRDHHGEPEYFIAIVEDISERKKTQDALRESEERFRLMADTAPVLIWMAGTDSLCTFFSKPWLEFTGRSFEQEQGNGWTEGVHPDDMQRCRDTYLTAFKARRNFEMEYRLRRADGMYRWIVDAGVPRFMTNGDFSGYIGSCFDITERKYAEEEIRKLNMILAENADELDAANKELEAFNYTVAHDLRGPLNNIGLYFQTIQQLYGAKLDETGREYVTGGYKNVQRMNQLIDVLLQFSKLSNAEPQRENFDISAMSREIVDELKRTSPERRHIFRTTDGIRADGDPKLLRVALSNLLLNAWKYTCKKEEATIEFGATEIGGKQAYFVKDNGEGFDLADADKLFIPFQRLPGSEEFKGSGIGLATVERIIRRHGGKVWAEGERGKGACFYFTLPVSTVS
jgi:PAS domain S-box-containing protein